MDLCIYRGDKKKNSIKIEKKIKKEWRMIEKGETL